ncbi:MAG TPA: hypothetical protein VHH73_19450, partial [Verrucomicrobiae bacterium]|nr:hypothetical protein [Verrucomicrobiae bacterium]
MKRILFLGCVLGGISGLMGQEPVQQGTVTFLNYGSWGSKAPVYDTDGTTLLSGTNYVAELYAGATADSLVPAGTPFPFRTGIGAGYFDPGIDSTRFVPVPAGDPAYCQFRVWDITFGMTYEEAVAAGSKHGQSNVALVQKTGGNVKINWPPDFPAYIVGWQSFALVPGDASVAAPQGFSLISNPLSHGGNTVAEILPNVPEGTVFYHWDSQAQTFAATSFTGGAWTNPGADFSPGTGAFLLNPATQPINVTFSGVAPSGPILARRVTGFYLIGSGKQVPALATDCLGFPPKDGDVIYHFGKNGYTA